MTVVKKYALYVICTNPSAIRRTSAAGVKKTTFTNGRVMTV